MGEKEVEVVAGCIIVNKKGEILLHKSPKWDGVYVMPGGHVKMGEAIIDAAVREGEEETGLKLKPLHCINIGELINDPAYHRETHFIYFHILCEAENDKLNPDPREVSSPLWVKPEDALKLKLAVGIIKTIENYIDGVKFEI